MPNSRPIPFDFVLERLEPLKPITKPMFGCTAVYINEKIVLILRNRPVDPEANGVWLATSSLHHQSLRQELPSLRSFKGSDMMPTEWQVIPVDTADFEASVTKACELIIAGDARIGKVPKSRTIKRPKSAETRQPRKVSPKRNAVYD